MISSTEAHSSLDSIRWSCKSSNFRDVSTDLYMSHGSFPLKGLCHGLLAYL